MLSTDLANDLSDIKMELLFNKNAAGFYIPYSGLPVSESNDIPTFITDGRQIQISYPFYKKLSKQEFKAVFFHEIVHNVLGHTSFVTEVKFPNILKRAEEIAVNNIVIACGLTLPKGEDTAGIVETQYAGWSTLAVYEDLVKKLPPDYELPQGGCCQPDITSDIPQEQLQAPPTNAAVKQKLAEVEQLLKSNGADEAVIKPVSELHRQLANPKLDWTEELRDSFIKSFDGEMLDLSRPIKQFMYHNIYMPTYKDENIDSLVMALDLSSSVTDEELAKGEDILTDIRNLYDIETTTIITFNHRIIGEYEYAQHEEISFAGLDAGGGTRIDSVFEYMKERQINPQALLLISDMEDRIETKHSDFPVIWLNTSMYDAFAHYPKPNFGKIINVKELV